MKVVWAPIANKQMCLILAYWKERNGSDVFPKKLYNKINAHIKVISTFPLSGKLVFSDNVRKIILGDFSIIYSVKNDTITILYFWDNRQEPQQFKI